MGAPARKRVAEDAADRLRTAILRGDYPAGTDLPGERELSLHLGVSRLTLRAALARLEGEGLVQPVHGSGNRVLDFRDTGGVELVGYLAVLSQEGTDALDLFASLLELRRTLAVEAIALAAARATADELAGLQAHVERQAALVGDARAYVRSDLALARRVAGMTHNLPLVFLANTLVRLLEQQPGIERAFVLAAPAAMAFYRRVLHLIAARDADTARVLARRMISRLDRALLARLGHPVATPTPPGPVRTTASLEPTAQEHP